MTRSVNESDWMHGTQGTFTYSLEALRYQWMKVTLTECMKLTELHIATFMYSLEALRYRGCVWCLNSVMLHVLNECIKMIQSHNIINCFPLSPYLSSTLFLKDFLAAVSLSLTVFGHVHENYVQNIDCLNDYMSFKFNFKLDKSMNIVINDGMWSGHLHHSVCNLVN